jgi:hypothetical protein
VFWGEESEERKISSANDSGHSRGSGRVKEEDKSAFLPAMPTAPPATTEVAKQSPLTPFDQGCLASMSPARSPYFPAFASQPKETNVEATTIQPNEFPIDTPKTPTAPPVLRPTTPHHRAKSTFRSTTISNDNNPIWTSNNFTLPLHKDDLLPSLSADGGRIALEILTEEEMAAPESLMMGGVSTATSLVPVVGKHIGTKGAEMLGLSSDRLIGRGYVDLMPLLLGVWEEEFDKENKENTNLNNIEEDTVDEFGKIAVDSHWKKRRLERMGVLDVWIPLVREEEIRGKVHLQISYQPNGMTPQKHDVVALESFARRPSLEMGSITPILPPLYPLSVVETKGSYLLCEYTTSRTVTSVDRSGNVKSSKWERVHRVRIHRNAAFVIERRTLLDTVGDVARLPGDIVFSTPIGREVADASAPIVAAASEVVAPMFIWGRLLLAAGGTGVKAGLVGLQAAGSLAARAVVEGSRDKVQSERYDRGEEGVYRYG